MVVPFWAMLSEMKFNLPALVSMTTPGGSPFARKAVGFVIVTTSASDIVAGKSLPASAEKLIIIVFVFSGKF